MPPESAQAATSSANQREPRSSPDRRGIAGVALLMRAVRPDARRFRWALAWLVIAGLLEALVPIMGKQLIDTQIVPRQFDARSAFWLLAGMLAAGWGAGLLRYFTLIRLAGVAMRSVQRLRQWAHEHVLRLPMAWFDQANTGQVVSRITNDTEQIRQLYVQVLFEVLQGATVLAGAVLAMAWLDWRLMLIMLVLIPVMTLIVWIYRRFSATAVAQTREWRSAINAQMAESMSGMALLQATGSAGRYAASFARTNHQYYGSRMREIRANAFLLRPALDLVNLLLIGAAIMAFGTLSFEGAQVGLLYAVISYIGRIVEPLIQITQQFSMLQQALVCAERLEQLLDEPAQPVARGLGRIADAGVRIESLTFGYRPGTPVLHGITMDMPAGSFTGIVGHTGAGKSTLLGLLLRFYQPWSGRIDLGGVALADLGEAAFRQDLAVVPQEPFLLAATVRDNIAMGRPLTHAQIERAARQAGAQRFIEALEQGYDTLLGEGGARLSAGQKQLLAIARALAGEPRILLLDEATARVDSATEREVSRALRSLHGRTTVIAIAHRLSTIRDADRIIVLNHGRVAESGSHPGLMAMADGIYRRLYQLQQIQD